MIELSFAIAVTVALAGGAVIGFINFCIYILLELGCGYSVKFPLSFFYIPVYLIWITYIMRPI